MTTDGPLVHSIHTDILRYDKHPSIIRIKEMTNEVNKFVFQALEYSEA